MKNVVTIDFDIIMGPSIDGYNDMISSETPMRHLASKFPYFGMAEADLYVYEYITRYLTEIITHIEDKDKIKFIATHDLMYHIYKNETEPFNLINIDHHHDINYIDDWSKPIIEIDEGNWVKRLFDMRKINRYIWVGNPNSVTIGLGKCPFMDKISMEILKDYDLGRLAANTDELVCCFSSAYIPPLYEPLFLTWRAIAEEIMDTDYLIIDNKDNL